MQKSKTFKYKPRRTHKYFYSTKPKIDVNGLTKQKGEPIRLYTMSELRALYPNLPNGRYYEYYISNDSCFEGKQCKEYLNDGIPLILEVYESIEPKYIHSQNICVDVKGGKLKFKDLSNERACDKRRKQNQAYSEFIQGHQRMGHLTTPVFFWFTEFYNHFQEKNKSLPYTFKDLLYYVYTNKDNKKEQNKASKAFVDYVKKALSKP